MKKRCETPDTNSQKKKNGSSKPPFGVLSERDAGTEGAMESWTAQRESSPPRRQPTCFRDVTAVEISRDPTTQCCQDRIDRADKRINAVSGVQETDDLASAFLDNDGS